MIREVGCLEERARLTFVIFHRIDILSDGGDLNVTWFGAHKGHMFSVQDSSMSPICTLHPCPVSWLGSTPSEMTSVHVSYAHHQCGLLLISFACRLGRLSSAGYTTWDAAVATGG